MNQRFNSNVVVDLFVFVHKLYWFGFSAAHVDGNFHWPFTNNWQLMKFCLLTRTLLWKWEEKFFPNFMKLETLLWKFSVKINVPKLRIKTENVLKIQTQISHIIITKNIIVSNQHCCIIAPFLKTVFFWTSGKEESC